jgi:ABC-2 type transport system permease protein
MSKSSTKYEFTPIGTADVRIEISLAITLFFLVACLAIITWIFKTGYRLKN